MAMGRKGPTQPPLWIPNNPSAQGRRHQFYEKLNELLAKHGFDAYVERICHDVYGPDTKQGRRSIPPGVYFRMLLVGYFEGIESERGICWRCSDSLSLRSFLGIELDEAVPEHSTLSRIRSRFAPALYEEVFCFVLSMVEREGLMRGKTVGVDGTYLRADASMKAIVRRDTDETYKDFLKRLAEESGIPDPTDEDARRFDRRRQ
jgi:transposase